MQNAYEPNQSTMAAIIGIDCIKAEKIISDNKLNVQIANDNSPIQIVISGKKEDLLNSEKFLKKWCFKIYFTKCFCCFPFKFNVKCSKKMNKFINNISFKSSNINIISNFSAESSNNISIIKKSFKANVK